MPGDHENVVKLNADHSGVCKFGSALEDQDNFKLVQSNIRDLYNEALRKSELSTLPILTGQGGALCEDSLQKRLSKLKGGNT
jgi:hypothetical protein